MKKNTFLVFILSFPFFLSFVSCVSTRVYVKTNDQVFINGELASETTSLTLDGKVKKRSQISYQSGIVEDISTGNKYYADAKTESSNKSQIKKTTITIRSGNQIIAEKWFRSKDGTIIIENSESTTSKQKSYSENIEGLLRDSFYTLQEEGEKNDLEQSKNRGDSITRSTETEKATVVSTPNKGYIAYSIIGKPFVILGTTTWNLMKCIGYACANFVGGYNVVTRESESYPIWLMPNVKKAKEKAAIAREANKLQYPEYHLPFTDNHITIEKMDSQILNAFTTSEDVKVVSTEKYEYDNSISVSRSASADANSTAGVVGVIGTVTTVPVSAITWVGGAGFGLFYQIYGNK